MRRHNRHHGWRAWVLSLVGLTSLLWFLLRVVPKPSRAAYPCQQVAGPLAGGFLLWLGGLIASTFAYRHAKLMSRRSRKVLAVTFLAVAASAGLVAIINTPEPPILAAVATPLTPVGVARGHNPGRVAWVHDPDATNWAGPGDGNWWQSNHTNQTVVDRMMSQAIRALGGENNDVAAWKNLFRYFNRTNGRGDVGYSAGEKICIKVNLVGCITSGTAVNTSTYNLVNNLDYMNTSPQMMLALLRQLVYVVGVDPANISIGDPTCRFPNQYYNPLNAEFPTVKYLDGAGGNASNPRTAVSMSTVRFYWSARPTGKTQDYVPLPYAQATYLINMANLKGHGGARITLCGKNHYGSMKRLPQATGYYNMHLSLPETVVEMGNYRSVVDLMGHSHIGRKTLLFLIDGLYSGVHTVDLSPRKWNSSPFNGDWTNSLFASQDPVAIDSVAFDFMLNEWKIWPDIWPYLSAADDYMHEAAQADNPPSGTFYDPDHATNTTRIPSLGVHENWNNATDKKYSRNLGIGDGIELLSLTWQPCDFDNDGDVDQTDFGYIQSCFSGSETPQTDPACRGAKLNSDEYVDELDTEIFIGCLSGSQTPADPNCAD